MTAAREDHDAHRAAWAQELIAAAQGTPWGSREWQRVCDCAQAWLAGGLAAVGGEHRNPFLAVIAAVPADQHTVATR